MILLEPNATKEYCLTIIKNKWLTSSPTFPDYLSEISNKTKLQNEQYIQTISNDFNKQFKNFPRLPLRRKKWKKITFNRLNEVLSSETIIGIHHYLDQPSLEAFQEELKDFLYHVRKFAPELSFEGIGQATRNYIVYAMFKQLNQMPSEFNKACFGYSMLYPFTDNYIDSDNFSAKQKIEYNQIIRDKIEGKDVLPKTLHQKKTCELLQAIESVYPRDCNSTIFTLLLMMLDAQEDSICQQNKGVQLTTDERLNISLYKGGISVLIDQFFVKNDFTEDDLNFYLGFGFFLQLVDDLQDMKEDYEQGNQTIFTVDMDCAKVEKIVNKLINFIHQITSSYQSNNDSFLIFLLENCYQLIYLSLAGSKEFFSKEYLDKLENFSLVTYSFLSNLKNNKTENKDIKAQAKHMKILDALIFK
jgi:hypothetical protein